MGCHCGRFRHDGGHFSPVLSGSALISTEGGAVPAPKPVVGGHCPPCTRCRPFDVAKRLREMQVPNLKIENGAEKWTWNPTFFAEFQKFVVEAVSCRFAGVRAIIRYGHRALN